MTAAAPRFFAHRISFYYAASFVTGGVVTPFLPVWLEFRGFTPELISACLAFPLIARLVFTPIGSWIADKAPNRRFAIILFAAGALALFVPAVLAEAHLTILVLTGLAITVSTMIQPAVDALALTGYRRFGLDYGKMRVWGSISFVIVSLGAGAIMGALGKPSLTIMLLAGFLSATLAAFALPVTPRVQREIDDAARPPPGRPAWAALTRRSFLAIVVSTALIQASHGVFYGFGSIHWANLGFSGGELGALWAIGVIAEIAMLRFSGRFRRFGAEAFIIAGAVGAIVRWSLFPFVTHFAPSMLLQTLHGLTFAATFVGMQMGIARDVGEEQTASAQGLCLIAAGLAMAVTTLFAGTLYAHLGGDAFALMSVFGVVGLIVAVLSRRSLNPTAPQTAG